MMGVDWADSFIVAELLGVKTFFNEFVAYLQLADLIKKRIDGLPEFIGNRKQYLSVSKISSYIRRLILFQCMHYYILSNLSKELYFSFITYSMINFPQITKLKNILFSCYSTIKLQIFYLFCKLMHILKSHT